jgi:hypothetical protein
MDGKNKYGMLGNLKERSYMQYGRMILNWILEKWYVRTCA